MKQVKKYTGLVLLLAVSLIMSLTACGSAPAESAASEAAQAAAPTFGVEETVTENPVETAETVTSEIPAAAAQAEIAAETGSAAEASETAAAESEGAVVANSETVTVTTLANVTSTGAIDATELFSDRDLTQTPDLSEAVSYVVSDNTDITITEEGVYVLSGSASNVTVYVETADTEAKVQLVLDGVSITNDDFPCIYATAADKVFVTTIADSSLSVTGTFTADGETNTDGVIFSRVDLVMNGTAALDISSTDNGVVSKDDLKVTGGTYNISASSKTLEANDSILVADGSLNLVAGTDGLHAENEDDDTLGYIYICGGTFNIEAGDDAIHAVSVVQIDEGTFTITAAEGIEATYIQINGGTINISASDDGINAGWKSSAYSVMIEINGGDITVVMGAGDTDGIDANGDITINGGTIDVTGNSTFDCDGTATYNGGTIICNGQQVDSIPTQMMGGGRRGW